MHYVEVIKDLILQKFSTLVKKIQEWGNKYKYYIVK